MHRYGCMDVIVQGSDGVCLPGGKSFNAHRVMTDQSSARNM